MMPEKKPYREGHDKTGDEHIDLIPITAFLVVQMPLGQADVIVKVPGFDYKREATLKDIQALGAAVSADAQSRITAGMSAEAMSQMMMKSMRVAREGQSNG